MHPYTRTAELGHERYRRLTPVLSYYDGAATVPKMSEYAIDEVREITETLVHGFTLKTVEETVDLMNFLLSLKSKLKMNIDFATWNPSVNGYGNHSGAYEGLVDVIWDAGHSRHGKERALEEGFMRLISIMNHWPPSLQAAFAPTVWAVSEKVVNNYFGRLQVQADSLTHDELHELYQVQRKSSREARKLLGRYLNGQEDQQVFAELFEHERWRELSERWGALSGLSRYRPELIAGLLAELPAHNGIVTPRVLRLPTTE